MTQRTGSGTQSRAIVMGGSIGGLTAGIGLRDLGWDVVVLERSPHSLEGRGAGIVVHPSTAQYLVDRCGLDLDRETARSERLRFLEQDGSIRYEEARPYRLTGWNTLYRSLLGALGPERYHLNSEVTSLRARDDDVEVGLRNGQHADADLVVCADGIASSAREMLVSATQPRYAGYVGWRGVVDEEVLSPATRHALDGAITYQVLDRSHILVYPIPGSDDAVESDRRMINFVWYRNVSAGVELDTLLTGRDGVTRTLSVPPGHVADRFISELRAAARIVLAPQLAEVVITSPQPFLQVIVDVEVPQMAFGQSVILGDAAFSARPHAAAGTAKACDDARALAAALENTSVPLEERLVAWEQKQLEVGRQLVARARHIGERSQVLNTFWPEDPALRFGLHCPGDSDVVADLRPT